MQRGTKGTAGACLVASCVAACAPPRPPAFPASGGTPFPDFAPAYQQATASCAAITTFTASMSLSGRAGETKLRGRIDAGFAAPARARLEGVAPFGRPVFVLTADGARATLVLQRDERVLADAPPDQIVEALAGVSLGPDALRRAVSGCGLSSGEPSSGQQFPDDLASVALPDGAAFLRRGEGAWHMAGATRGPVTLSYVEYANGRPSTIRLRAESGGRVSADLTLRLSQVEINTPLDAKVFQAEVPPRAIPLTLEELRRAGPLGSKPERPEP
jgi:outer membrane lipoprotein-sorting protein